MQLDLSPAKAAVKAVWQKSARGLKRAGHSIGSWLSETFDWPLAILLAAFVAALPINGQVGGVLNLASQGFAWWFIPDLNADYERGIAEAALKRPGYQVRLTVIPDNMMNVPVAHFGLAGRPVDNKSELWVALASELKKACSGDSNPTLKLQQVLGLPPDLVSTYVVTELSVLRADLFRPCMGATDLRSDSCGVGFFELPQENNPANPAGARTVATNSVAPSAAPTTAAQTEAVAEQISGANAGGAKPGNTNADAAKTEYYKRLTFIARQMWNTYRLGFPRSLAASPGYPYTGYPFTGMGWAYNWARFSPSHVGVSEFVVSTGATLTEPKTVTPATFCQAPAS